MPAAASGFPPPASSFFGVTALAMGIVLKLHMTRITLVTSGCQVDHTARDLLKKEHMHHAMHVRMWPVNMYVLGGIQCCRVYVAEGQSD